MTGSVGRAAGCACARRTRPDRQTDVSRHQRRSGSSVPIIITASAPRFPAREAGRAASSRKPHAGASGSRLFLRRGASSRFPAVPAPGTARHLSGNCAVDGGLPGSPLPASLSKPALTSEPRSARWRIARERLHNVAPWAKPAAFTPHSRAFPGRGAYPRFHPPAIIHFARPNSAQPRFSSRTRSARRRI